jgi:hypothetical protein
MPRSLTPPLASKFSDLALAGLGREWPHLFQHLAHRPVEMRRPREQHPAFYGCYDWHSSVHGHWTLARVLRLHPSLPSARRIRAALDQHLTSGNLATELAYFQAPDRGGFERPYGWGWLLALAAEVRRGEGPSFRAWARALRPLEKHLAESFGRYLPRLPYPVRSGVHSNTAFGLTLALDYARATGHSKLEAAIVSHGRRFYSLDRDAPVGWEPSGEDFLSPALTEVDLVSRILSPAEFRRWLPRFLPGLAQGRLGALAQPPRVIDRTDGKQVHLDGLCLSRAWGLERIAAAHPGNAAVRRAAKRHARAGLLRVSSGDYAGEHWLATFATYLLTAGSV